MLRLVRIGLLVFAVLMFAVFAGLTFMSALNLPRGPGPGIQVHCALGSESARQDAEAVDTQVGSILDELEIDGHAWVSERKSKPDDTWGWIVMISISTSAVDITSAKQTANRILNAILLEFPESELIGYEPRTEISHAAPWVSFLVLCAWAMMTFWLLLRWRPGSPREQDEQCAE